MKSIGERIQKLRISAGMTQGQLAEKLGIAPSTVGMYEQGRRNPDAAMLVKIGELFSVTVDSLLGMSEEAVEVSEIVRQAQNRILHGEGILLNGKPMTQKERERLLCALEVATNVTIADMDK